MSKRQKTTRPILKCEPGHRQPKLIWINKPCLHMALRTYFLFLLFCHCSTRKCVIPLTAVRPGRATGKKAALPIRGALTQSLLMQRTQKKLNFYGSVWKHGDMTSAGEEKPESNRTSSLCCRMTLHLLCLIISLQSAAPPVSSLIKPGHLPPPH